ncbi:CTP synthase [Malacoplasma penetrans]|uniref:CTP synthase n=1 Tax=Malacoplasma penetrans TaxID=28227 RepID=UPI0002F0DBE9|nr:CTP synthase [Malacoplasma penetrans]
MSVKLNDKTKILIVTGGVFSSLGKGVACSSLGAMLKCFGQEVLIMKFDPYLNVDAGTMAPGQHGEVFVTFDGRETDLDIGNYERFLNINLPKESNVTAGRVYYETIAKERDGKFLGATIQVVPHITEAISQKIILLSNKYQPDFLIVEVGGTVGDIESIPFLEATRQLQAKYRSQVMFIHTVPLIELLTGSDLKTKPLQHSVKDLMSAGIFPNLLLVRSKDAVSNKLKEKISLTTGIENENIYSLINLKHIYLLPESLENQKVQNSIFNFFKMEVPNRIGYKHWDTFTSLIKEPKKYKARIAVVGKYSDSPDAYLSIISSLEISSFYLKTDLSIEFINSSSLNENNISELSEFDAILVPGGFGKRDIEGKILAIQYARENNIPFFGICLGMQLASIEFARNVLKMHDADSTEFNENTANPIITILEGKNRETNLGGTLRLGNYNCELKDGSKILEIYKRKSIVERHRHRYEFNPKYMDIFEKHGFVFSGINKENNLVEIIELENHKFFIAVQFHPEFTSKILSPNPIFYSFLNVSKKPI